MLAEHDRRADALARPTAIFPLHDVTDVFARGRTSRTCRSSLIACRGKRSLQAGSTRTPMRSGGARWPGTRKRNEDGVRPAKWVLTEPCIQ
jgi:hypothetical protein